MREMEWPPRLPLAGPVVDLPDLGIASGSPGGATLISGDLDAGIEALTGEAPRVGLGGVAGDPPFFLVIARDRGCLVSRAALDVESGWDARGFAATPADDAWVFFTIWGARAEEVLAEGCAADLGSGSPSAATLFAGQPALVVRQKDAFLVGIESSNAESIARWLAAVACKAG